MPRRYKPERRESLPDPVYNNKQVTRFINRLMTRGKKSTAERVFYKALDRISKKIKGEEPLQVFLTAMKKTTPLVEVKARRVGGSTYQVPVEVRPERGEALASGWIIKFAKGRGGRTMDERLSEELMAAYNGEGSSIKKKDDTHKMAEANKAFAHYRY